MTKKQKIEELFFRAGRKNNWRIKFANVIKTKTVNTTIRDRFDN
jgi:hypothetical protein